MDNKIKHLEMIQGIIDRMGSNSFLIKGWTIILISGIFAVYSSTQNLKLLALAYFPAIVYWLLDSYYLWQEKLFRALYDAVRIKDDSKIDFSMDVSAIKKQKIVPPWGATIISGTLLAFHVPIIIILTIIGVIYSS